MCISLLTVTWPCDAQVSDIDQLAAKYLGQATGSAHTLVKAIERTGGCSGERAPSPSWDKEYKSYSIHIAAAATSANLQKIYDSPAPKIGRVTQLRFEIADYALKMNCLNAADEQYREILKADDPSSRDRARVGIDDVRDRRKSRPESPFDQCFSFPK
ncbi:MULTISPECIES: hypothetical protein [unclassified Bradyrhizobium]|uniref:hypothetical protein n=1 Tax=unclassified Bradyrhizobium TaxID=2631580 RepID=UPI003396EEBC